LGWGRGGNKKKKTLLFFFGDFNIFENNIISVELAKEL
jgi:hypothetical protein